MNIKLYMCGGEKPISQYPLGLGYLLSNIKNCQASIVQSSKELINCDLIGLSSNANGITEAIKIADNTNIPVVVGGQAALWDGVINYNFKHVVVGEGERALQSIVDGSTERIFRHIQMQNIDDILPPVRGTCRDIVPITTARGCPYRCRFCSSNAQWKKTRLHSAQYVINEIEEITKQYPHAKKIYVLDDLFIASRKRFYQIKELWMSKGYQKKYVLESFIRSNLFDYDIAMSMKEMGFKTVRFGAESGSNRVLSFLGKQATVEDNQNAIDVSKKAGLPVCASFMHDVPSETKEEKQETLDFIKRNENKMSVKGFYRYCSFPGTDLYDGVSPLDASMNVR